MTSNMGLTKDEASNLTTEQLVNLRASYKMNGERAAKRGNWTLYEEIQDKVTVIAEVLLKRKVW